eukprot:TRINITY_DN72576_c0_g1_i1.p1 TRINITY_DN72576_c0_g1~~TRINITY_DN72576_c0_g1_i1.p1  ORF type:complete len:176 (-),score=32.33 TRINITY_DN72576_c0_g1_i1:448-975(-)
MCAPPAPRLHPQDAPAIADGMSDLELPCSAMDDSTDAASKCDFELPSSEVGMNGHLKAAPPSAPRLRPSVPPVPIESVPFLALPDAAVQDCSILDKSPVDQGSFISDENASDTGFSDDDSDFSDHSLNGNSRLHFNMLGKPIGGHVKGRRASDASTAIDSFDLEDPFQLAAEWTQ